MAVHETEQAHVAHGKHVKALFLARDDEWRHVERMLVRQKLQPMRRGACEVVSGSSLLGFSLDRKIYQSVP